VATTAKQRLARGLEDLVPGATQLLEDAARRGYEPFMHQLAEVLVVVVHESVEAYADLLRTGPSAGRVGDRPGGGLRLVSDADSGSGPIATGGATGAGGAGATASLQVLGRDRALLRVGDREIALSRRHSEIVVLLAAHPAGMTGEQLALALYGERGKPQTARAEISRLRRVLGTRLQTDPYRLPGVVRSDSAEVERLLRDGRAGDAAALYRGPLLPRSDAPGVVDLRNELDDWTRRAALAADDAEALWKWVNTPSGQDDIPAWKRLLTIVPHHDARRALAAARLARLRPPFTLT
jgi:hypothetical protein